MGVYDQFTLLTKRCTYLINSTVATSVITKIIIVCKNLPYRIVIASVAAVLAGVGVGVEVEVGDDVIVDVEVDVVVDVVVGDVVDVGDEVVELEPMSGMVGLVIVSWPLAMPPTYALIGGLMMSFTKDLMTSWKLRPTTNAAAVNITSFCLMNPATL